MELEEAIKDIEVWLDFPVWFIHTGRDEDFLRRIDKSAIETLLNHLAKQEKMIELMSRFIDTELSSEHLSKVLKIDVKPLETYRENIKQYFEKKADEEAE